MPVLVYIGEYIPGAYSSIQLWDVWRNIASGQLYAKSVELITSELLGVTYNRVTPAPMIGSITLCMDDKRGPIDAKELYLREFNRVHH